MASHDLINTKPTILGATLGAIPGIAANPPERFSFAPAFSERFFENWGGPHALPEYRVSESDPGRLWTPPNPQQPIALLLQLSSRVRKPCRPLML